MTTNTHGNIPEDLFPKSPISVETQVRLWRKLAGRWNDDRSTKEIIDDIYRSRTAGRDVIMPEGDK